MVDEKILLKEVETFDKNKQILLRDSSGKFVLIKGEKVIEVYDSQNDAIKVGIDKFGNSPFLVKKIEEMEQSQNFTSNLIELTECHQ